MFYGRRIVAVAAVLVSSGPITAQDISVSHSDATGMSLTAQACGNDRAHVEGLDPAGAQVDGRVSRSTEPRTVRAGIRYEF